MSQEWYTARSFEASRTSLTTEKDPTLNLGDPNSMSNDASYSSWALRSGFARVSYSGELKHGWKPLVADGNGGVREDANGIQRLVIQVDEEEHTAVICL